MAIKKTAWWRSRTFYIVIFESRHANSARMCHRLILRKQQQNTNTDSQWEVIIVYGSSYLDILLLDIQGFICHWISIGRTTMVDGGVVGSDRQTTRICSTNRIVKQTNGYSMWLLLLYFNWIFVYLKKTNVGERDRQTFHKKA